MRCSFQNANEEEQEEDDRDWWFSCLNLNGDLAKGLFELNGDDSFREHNKIDPLLGVRAAVNGFPPLHIVCTSISIFALATHWFLLNSIIGLSEDEDETTNEIEHESGITVHT